MRFKCESFLGVVFGAAVGFWIWLAVTVYPSWDTNVWMHIARDGQEFGRKIVSILSNSSDQLNESAELVINETASRLVSERFDRNASGITILCVIISITNNGTHLRAINRTYGKRCDRLAIYSMWGGIRDFDVSVISNARTGTWKFMRAVLLHMDNAFKSYNYSWILLIDDTTYAVIDNLRYYLLNNVNLQLIGRVISESWFWRSPRPVLDLNAGVVIKWSLVTSLLPHLSTKGACKSDNRKSQCAFADCLRAALGVQPVDAKDPRGGHRFLPDSADQLFDSESGWPWFLRFLVPSQDPATCCSDLAITFGSSTPADFYMLEYMIYRVQPYGIDFRFDQLGA